MTETRKNILRDVMCSVENLQDCLEVLLREEETYARRQRRRSSRQGAYEEAAAACDDLRTVISHIGAAVESSGRLRA